MRVNFFASSCSFMALSSATASRFRPDMQVGHISSTALNNRDGRPTLADPAGWLCHRELQRKQLVVRCILYFWLKLSHHSFPGRHSHPFELLGSSRHLSLLNQYRVLGGGGRNQCPVLGSDAKGRRQTRVRLGQRHSDRNLRLTTVSEHCPGMRAPLTLMR